MIVSSIRFGLLVVIPFRDPSTQLIAIHVLVPVSIIDVSPDRICHGPHLEKETLLIRSRDLISFALVINAPYCVDQVIGLPFKSSDCKHVLLPPLYLLYFTTMDRFQVQYSTICPTSTFLYSAPRIKPVSEKKKVRRKVRKGKVISALR